MSTAPASPQSGQAVFLQGTIMRHVVVMTLTGAVGLMAVFAVDLADLYFLSMLNDTNVLAAIGFAGILSYTNLSASIGLGIATAALVARNMGAGNRERARDYATSTFLFTLLMSGTYTLLAAIFAKPLLGFLGAEGPVVDMAASFIWILSPGFVLLAAALSCSFALRGIGDAQRAMYITLAAALCTVILDPLFIFYLGMGMNGAALANVIADGAALALGLSGIVGKHRFLKHLSFAGLARDFKDIWKIAFPSLLTQLATPFTVAYSTTVVARFGAEALAANAIIGRLVPVAYGIIFSLSGAVGPIIGQNFGAKNFHRVRQTLTDGLTFAAVYTIITSIILLIFRHEIADAFQTTGHAKDLVVFFCTFVAWSWAFAGAQFVANAAFNNLGRPVLSTWYNWGKATLGTIPFALLGAAYYGAEGIMFGLAIGSVIFGIASAMHSFRITRALEMKA